MAGFWDKFGKATAVGGVVGLGAGVLAKGVSSCVKSSFDRKIKQQELNLKQQQQLLDQEIKLKELQLKEQQMNVGANKDITLAQINSSRDLGMQQMKSQQAIHTTGLTAQADVAKAEAMYSPDSALAQKNGMFYDANSGVAMDNRNVVYNTAYGVPYGGMMGVGPNSFRPGPNNPYYGQNMNQLQQKLLEAKSLLDRGMITEEEFQKVKKDILDDSF